MTYEIKRRRLLTHDSTTATDQGEAHSNDKGKCKASNSNNQSNSDHVINFISNLIGDDMKQIKRYAGEILHHDRSTVELRADGSIVITPHPRQLPNEIVSLIIGHVSDDQQTLYECTLVSKQFHAIAYPLLWQLPICIPDDDSFERFLTCISYPSQQLIQQYPQQTIGHYIRHLSLDGFSWTDDHLLRLLPHIPRLKRLTSITVHDITDTSFQHLPYQCHHLTSLQLMSLDLTQVSFSAIGRYCHQLCDLDWEVLQGQSPEWLDFLTTSCPLQRLKITSHLDLPLTGKVMTAIKAFNQLTCLDFTEDAAVTSMKSFLQPTTSTSTTRSTTTTTTIHWPQLTTLALDPCSDLDDTTLGDFIKSHPHLRHLDLGHAEHLTNPSLAAMAVWLPHLMHVRIMGNAHLSTTGIRRFVQSCFSPSLASVQFYSRHRVVRIPFPESSLSGGTVVNLDRKEIETIKQRRQSSDHMDIGKRVAWG